LTVWSFLSSLPLHVCGIFSSHVRDGCHCLIWLMQRRNQDHELPIQIPTRKPTLLRQSLEKRRGETGCPYTAFESSDEQQFDWHDHNSNGGRSSKIWNQKCVTDSSRVLTNPQTIPRSNRLPWPVRLPASETSSANPIEIRSPTLATSRPNCWSTAFDFDARFFFKRLDYGGGVLFSEAKRDGRFEIFLGNSQSRNG
jgi:hypothetical protein